MSDQPNYKAFAVAIIEDFPDSFPDGFDIQDLAVEHGLLKTEIRYKACGEHCQCREYFTEDELARGAECLRRHPDTHPTGEQE